MDVPDYLKYKIILPPGYWGYPPRLGLFNEASFTKTDWADISAGITPDTAVELLFPEIPPLFLSHPF